MKVMIEDFGPVERFEFDTDKSMHLIVGNNNVGKSYALTAYYFAIKTLLGFRGIRGRFYYHDDLDEVEGSSSSRKNEEYLARIKEKKSGDLDIQDIYKDAVSLFLKDVVAGEFTQQIKSSFHEFESIANQFSSRDVSRITFDMPHLKLVLEGNIDEFRVSEVDFGYSVVLRTVKQNREAAFSGNKLVIYRKVTDSALDILEDVRLVAARRSSSAIFQQTRKITDINYLPASRSGLYQALSAFGLIIAELSKSRSLITSKIELPGISGQLSDYFIKLTSIVEPKVDVVSSFEDIAGKIESSVLRGKIEYDYIKKKLYYSPDNTTLRLDLSATSSMVSEIGPIVAYIRHIISEGMDVGKPSRRRIGGTFGNSAGAAYLQLGEDRRQILIIEEPEAHLHPLNQIKMTELYAELTKIGVNVIMTSHSNYVFNKVSNLVISGGLTPKLVRCDLFDMKETGSVGTAQEIDEYGIDDKNFVDASEFLLNEKLSLLDGVGL